MLILLALCLFFNKTFSFDYREDTIPNPEYIEKLKKEKQEWEQESHICNSCLKKKIKQESKDITNNFTEDFSKIQEYHKERIEFANKMQRKMPLFYKSDIFRVCYSGKQCLF